MDQFSAKLKYICDKWERKTVPKARLLLALCAGLAVSGAAAGSLEREWPKTDFSVHSVDLAEIRSGGPPRDGIPAIDAPRFAGVATAGKELDPDEPVISLNLNGTPRAYPLRVLIWHEIVNDTVGGLPVAVTYCPLCNAAIVFGREVDGVILDFGTTGRLRNSDLVMYDRQTESWWQQYDGTAIVGTMTGKRLDRLAARLEAFRLFSERHPDGEVLVPADPTLRPYGANPYQGYDTGVPFLYDGSMPAGIAPMTYVVVAEGRAWSLDLLREQKTIRWKDVALTWSPGQRSALDTAQIASGRDIGNVVVQKETSEGPVDIPYDVTFAFVYHAFSGGKPIHYSAD
ncbi:MAG: DUF3179 domain-containing protein [Rhodospirillales bacterium]|nr:DUF3179 domain-containing protein [Rhodospirillales bacterium]